MSCPNVASGEGEVVPETEVIVPDTRATPGHAQLTIDAPT